MKTAILTAISLSLAAARASDPSTQIVVAVGAPGSDEYRETFAETAAGWEQAAVAGGASVQVIGLEEDESSDVELFEAAVTAKDGGASPMWIVLIGHGTFDGRDAKFNMRGDDLSADHLARWLEDSGRPIVVINTTAASAPFIKALSGENRVIVSATKSGSEESFARFGQFLAKAIAAEGADIDGDGGTSLLEAFVKASKDVAEFYEKEGRIATEQALIDDNGDGLGTPASWFRGTRAVKNAKEGATPDGPRAHQFHIVPSEEERRMPRDVRERRDALETELATLRAKRETMEEEAYFAELERIALALAQLYRDVD